jgi:subtilisin family serine protease
MNARIINFSAGGRERNPAEEKAIAEAGRRGILFVAAAGNERANSDLSGFFPADYGLSNILSVGALGKNKNLITASNFGRRTVDLAAPGEAIISTYPGGGYGFMTGTSQATAFATAAASLLLSEDGRRTPEEIIKTLSATGIKNPNLLDRTRFEVQIDSYRALAMKDSHHTLTGLRSLDGDLVFSTDILDGPRETASKPLKPRP